MMWFGSRIDTAASDGMEPVFLGIGTNVGNRAANVRDALAGLRRFFTVDAVSAIYESEPFGYADQPFFWNLACRGRTPLEPRPLMAAIQALEHALGRAPTFRMGPRLIDIDILLYGDRIVEEQDLVIPHPGLTERHFVLRPLLDIDTALCDPRSRVPLSGRLAGVATHGAIRRVGSVAELLEREHRSSDD
jgi:2-amino-4-hydroxy-6-hydroxymethyldihydropteridine diphosphokinase